MIFFQIQHQLFNHVNRKGNTLRSEIYNWLVVC
jgi:hypothetical protein